MDQIEPRQKQTQQGVENEPQTLGTISNQLSNFQRQRQPHSKGHSLQGHEDGARHHPMGAEKEGQRQRSALNKNKILQLDPKCDNRLKAWRPNTILRHTTLRPEVLEHPFGVLGISCRHPKASNADDRQYMDSKLPPKEPESPIASQQSWRKDSPTCDRWLRSPTTGRTTQLEETKPRRTLDNHQKENETQRLSLCLKDEEKIEGWGRREEMETGFDIRHVSSGSRVSLRMEGI